MCVYSLTLDRSRRIVSSTPRHRSISVASHSCIPTLRQLCVSANEEEPRPRIRCSRRPRASCRMGPASAERSPTSLPPLAGRLRRPPAIVASPSTSLASPSSGRWHGRLPRAPSAATYEDDNATSCTCHCLPPRWWHRLRGTACSAELGHTTNQHPQSLTVCVDVWLFCVCVYMIFSYGWWRLYRCSVGPTRGVIARSPSGVVNLVIFGALASARAPRRASGERGALCVTRDVEFRSLPLPTLLFSLLSSGCVAPRFLAGGVARGLKANIRGESK